MRRVSERFFSEIVLAYPKAVLAVVALLVGILGAFAFRMEIDASSETLLLQHDKDLAFTRQVNRRFHNPDYLVITYTPRNKDLLDSQTLADIDHLSKELLKIKSVESITSILNVPLLQHSPGSNLAERIKNIPTLEDPDIDKERVKKEFLTSPIYANNLVSPDLKTTALMVNFYDDKRYFELLYKRNDLSDKRDAGTMSPEEAAEFAAVEAEFKAYRDQLREANHRRILDIRQIMAEHRGDAELFLGGVDMIADDMVSYVKYDLKTYGGVVLGLLIIVMWIVFRQLRFILLPVLILSLSVLATTGLLGLFGWEVTVVSSNFISLQLIVTMSLVIHLTVRYREELTKAPDEAHRTAILNATTAIFIPCVFVILTTIAGFCSLMAGDLLPVINLGWMMSTGIFISLIITFLVFPAVMVQLPKKAPNTHFESHFVLTRRLGRFAEHFSKLILIISVAIAVFSITGASKLKVENSFIDYFKESTEIYKGMEVIDRQLGGTTPLDVIINFAPEAKKPVPAAEPAAEEAADEFADFEAEFEAMEEDEAYWFTSAKMARIEAIHDYLETVPGVGKVSSFATTLKVGRGLNGGGDLDNLELALLYKELPEKFKNFLINPYLNLENNQVRFTMRIVDSMPELRRDALLKQIKRELHEKVGVPAEDIRLANMMVMYNNVLQSLFDSQIKTLGLVVIILAIMFQILFKSIKIGLIAMAVNVVPVSMVFGVMGWVGIPLDIMTITIAAISMGIAVDDTIHYIHRFKIEVAKDGDYLAAMHRSHASIGYAMYYTTVAIMLGFSVLVLSNFLPTIYFGLLTMLTMFMAIVGDLLMLPVLIVMFKPFGKNPAAEGK